MCSVNQYISLCVHWYVFFQEAIPQLFLFRAANTFSHLPHYLLMSLALRFQGETSFSILGKHFFFYIKWCVLLFFIDLPLWFRHEHLIPHIVYKTPQSVCCRCVSSSFFDFIFAQHLLFFVSDDHVAWRNNFAIDVWVHRFTFHCILCLRYMHLVIYANAAMRVSSLSFVRS